MVGSVVWSGRDDRGALRVSTGFPRLVRAAQLDQAEVLRGLWQNSERDGGGSLPHAIAGFVAMAARGDVRLV